MTDQIEHDEHGIESPEHRAACAECAVVWADLERISAEAGRLPLLTPSRDLWLGIESRIDASAAAQTRAAVTPLQSRRGWLVRPAFRMAIAASALVAVSAGVTWQVATSGSIAQAVGSATPSAIVPSAVGIAQLGQLSELASLTSVNQTVISMDREIADLQSIVDERRDLLDPATITVLEQNLALIDRAIAESRRALEADPASRFLAAQFARAYTSKLTLLRDVATLPTDI